MTAPGTTDPVSLIAALVAIFAVAGAVWLLIAGGLREAAGACACLAGANALLAAAFLLNDAVWVGLPMQEWLAGQLSLAAFGLVRVAVPLVAEHPPPWRRVVLAVLAVGVVTARLGEGLPMLLLQFGVMGLMSLLAGLDAVGLLRERGLNARSSLLLALPLLVLALLTLARPLEAWWMPGRSPDIDVRTPFNIVWLWTALALALVLNGTLAFLLLMKLVLQIQRLTRRDPLTDAFNRRALSEAMDREHARQRRGHGYALVLLDMDRFKQLNDTLGHAAGDAALKTLVEVVQPCLREVDLLGRLGGEEFCALLPDTGIAGAALVAERMRALLAQQPFAWDGQHWPLTASFGIAECAPEDESAADTLRRADQALYRAKAQGRNVVQAVERDAGR